MSSQASKTSDSFKTSTPWILSIAGLGMLLSGYLLQSIGYKIPSEILIQVGSTVLAGGIFAAVMKWMQFIGLIKDDLTEIIYGRDHLEKRQDIYQIWQRVSSVLFQDKFPGISAEIMTDVNKLYFPKDHIAYYQDYRQSLVIELADEQKEIILVKQTLEYKCFPRDTEAPFTHKATHTSKVPKKSEIVYSIVKYEINTTNYSPPIDIKEDNNHVYHSIEIKLPPSDCFEFNTETHSQFCLRHENVVGTVKPFIIKNLDLIVHLGKNLDVELYSCGTIKQFKPEGVQRENFRHYRYDGLIYPNQGFLLCVKKT